MQPCTSVRTAGTGEQNCVGTRCCGLRVARSVVEDNFCAVQSAQAALLQVVRVHLVLAQVQDVAQQRTSELVGDGTDGCHGAHHCMRVRGALEHEHVSTSGHVNGGEYAKRTMHKLIKLSYIFGFSTTEADTRHHPVLVAAIMVALLKRQREALLRSSRGVRGHAAFVGQYESKKKREREAPTV